MWISVIGHGDNYGPQTWLYFNPSQRLARLDCPAVKTTPRLCVPYPSCAIGNRAVMNFLIKWYFSLRRYGAVLVLLVRPQARTPPNKARVDAKLSLRGRIICVKSDSEVHFIKGMYPICYVSGRWLQRTVLSMKNVIQPLYSICTQKAQSRATQFESSIGHRKLQTVRNKLLFIPTTSTRGDGGDDSSM
jgi:hypothetical protein